MDSAMFGRVDVVLHVPDEERFCRIEFILLKNFVDAGAFIPDFHVRPFNELPETGAHALDRIMIPVNRAQNESLQASSFAKFEKFPGMREFDHRMLHLLKFTMKPGL